LTTAPHNLCLALDGARFGPRAAALTPAWLWVRQGMVEHLAAHPPAELPVDTVYLQGGWAVEPLADAHVHLFLCGAFSKEERAATARLDRDEALQRILDLLADYRGRGIAAVRDGGDPHGLALEAAEVANRHPDRYAAVGPSGEPVFRRGLYGGFLGAGVETPREAARLLERNRRRGATQAKLLATGLNSLDRPGQVGPHQFSPKELREVTAAARALELPTMAHANGPLGAVLSSAPTSVEHGFWAEPQDLAVLAGQGVAWVPTVGAWARLAAHPGLTPAQKQVVAATDRRHREAIAEGVRLGVRLTAGSDAGTPGVRHGAGLLEEIERLAAAGLGRAAALATGTYRARRLCRGGTDRALDGLVSGGPGGFLWLAADPVADPEALSSPRGVFLGGTWSSRGNARG